MTRQAKGYPSPAVLRFRLAHDRAALERAKEAALGAAGDLRDALARCGTRTKNLERLALAAERAAGALWETAAHVNGDRTKLRAAEAAKVRP